MSRTAQIIQSFGMAMQRHRRLIQSIQWLVVSIYLILLIIPAFLSLPPRGAHILDNLVFFAQFIFWGIWWPFVIISMLVMGRMWCGVFCPEGTLTEWTSHSFGRNLTIPRWIKWRGWPAVAFVLTTLYGQLISVYDYAQATLLILGGSTIGAIIIGYLYGRGTRVWCRYLCPVNGVFNLLSRLSPITFKTDQKRWANYPEKPATNPHCPPMINIHQLHGVSACHMCAQCAGYRNAVALTPRSVNEEVLLYGSDKHNIWEHILLLYGMIGVAIGAFTWTVSPWFIYFYQTVTTWLVQHDILWPLNNSAPWWILTNHPANNDTFTLAYGFCVTTYILGSGILYGSFLSVIFWITGKLANRETFGHHLALALLPLAACGLFLGLSATTVKLLQFDGFFLPWLSTARALLLIGATIWSFYLGFRIIWNSHNSLHRSFAISTLYGITILPILTAWWLMFWGW